MKPIESIIGSNPTHLPTWLTRRNVIAVGVVVGTLLAVGAGAFAWWERKNALEDAQLDATTIARALGDESARAVSTANVLANALADEPIRLGSAHANDALRRTIAGVPFVRSISYVSDAGVVLASSNPANLAQRIDVARLPGATAPNGGGSPLAIGRPVKGRDLASSELARDPHAYPAALPVGFVPLARPVTLENGAPGQIVAALNADYLSNTFQVTLSDPRHAAAIVRYDGIALTATRSAHVAGGADLSAHPLFTRMLKQRDWGTFVGAGLDGAPAVVAYRASRAWPLVTVVEFPYDTVLEGWHGLLNWVVVLTGFALTMWFLACIAAVQSLERNESANRALDRLVRKITNDDARRTALLASSLDGMIAFDSNGTIVEFNPAAERIFGYSRARVVGKRKDEILPEEIRTLTLAQQAGASGREAALPRARIELTARRANGQTFSAEMSVVPVSANDEQLYFCTVRDLSDSERAAREHAQLLQKYRDSSSDLRGLKNALDKHAIVSILSDDGQILYANTMLASVSGYAREVLTGESHRLLWPDEDAGGLTTDALLALIRDGRPWAGQLAHRKHDGSLFWAASTLVPITGEAHERKHAFLIQTDISRQIAGEKALQAAHEAEIALGAGIQRGLLIRSLPPCVLDCLAASFNLASRGINGDFFDLFEYDAQHFDILVGDAMGKGVPAALLGAALKMQFARSLAELHTRDAMRGADALPSPAAVIAHVQHAMQEQLQDLDSFVTVCYIRIDRARGTLTWVGCGHEETMLLRAGAAPRYLPNQHPPLGLISDDAIVEDTVPLTAGDTVLLYSDGVTDAVGARGERYGLARLAAGIGQLLETHRRPGMILTGVRRALEAFTAGGPVADDMTMVILQLPDDDTQTSRAHFEMPRALDALDGLRRFVSGHAADAGLDECAAAALTLAAVELASNAIRHEPALPESPIEAVLTGGDRDVRLELLYEGTPFQPPEHLNPDFSGHSEGGFGLYIIRASCDDVQYAHAGGVNRVTLTKRRAEAAPAASAAA